jgi:hypothetical protein
MIRLPVKTKKGVYRVMRTRVPRTRTFDLYRKAEAKAPVLIDQIYVFIAGEVEAHPTETAHHSGPLLDRMPLDWLSRKQWLQFSDSEAERRSLFEQVLWTYFFDRHETWETTWPDKGQIGAVYFREAAKPLQARELGLRPEGEGVAPKAASRGIGLERAGPPTAVPAGTSPTEELSPGDIVIILKGRYKGLTGEIAGLESDGPFISATVRLPADDEYLDVPGFRLKDLMKTR